MYQSRPCCPARSTDNWEIVFRQDLRSLLLLLRIPLPLDVAFPSFALLFEVRELTLDLERRVVRFSDAHGGELLLCNGNFAKPTMTTRGDKHVLISTLASTNSICHNYGFWSGGLLHVIHVRSVLPRINTREIWQGATKRDVSPAASASS
jgi:hypothetical protein